MMSEHRPDRKITLEDLLRVKRAERPPADFWTQFERELRTRQLAAAVEKRRWWDGLPRVFAGLARYQVPVGAAAVVAVTFLAFREYRQPGAPAELGSPVVSAPAEAEAEERAPVENVVELAVVDVTPRPAPRERPAVRQPATPAHSLSPIVPWTAAVNGERELSPSERSIAANLAAAEPEFGRMLVGSAGLQLDEPAQREPLAQLTSPRDHRRQRLFAYDAQLAGFTSGSESEVAPERVASRLDESELYETVRRLSGGGDRLTLKF